MEYTERPDTVTAQLLEGRFAIFVDGTPFALIGPVTMWQMMQASEDYYERFFISNMVRWIRFLFLILALFLPALYVAVTTYHHDMLPTTLILSIAAARESIPFPALVEALMMEISFEALREAGIRLPKRSVRLSVSLERSSSVRPLYKQGLYRPRWSLLCRSQVLRRLPSRVLTLPSRFVCYDFQLC